MGEKQRVFFFVDKMNFQRCKDRTKSSVFFYVENIQEGLQKAYKYAIIKTL